MAQTLDGFIATLDGQSQWIGGPKSLALAHRLRAEHDAVLVGIGTVLADDPQLTVRLVDGRSPERIVLDSALRIPISARVLQNQPPTTTVVATARARKPRLDAVRATGARVLVMDRDVSGQVDLGAMLQALADHGIRSLLVEGGSAVITAFLRQALVDRFIVCIAPRILGAGIPVAADLGIRGLAQALCLRDVRITRVGEDVIVDGTLAPHAVAPG